MNSVIDHHAVLVAAAGISEIAGFFLLLGRRERAALCFIAAGLVFLFTAVLS